MLNIGMVFNFLENISSNLSIGLLDEIWRGMLQMLVIVSMWVLSLTKVLLNLIFDISKTNFFTQNSINGFLSRIYIVLGVLMLFKITISCIQYLINPDKADDKESGFGGILKRTLIAVALLVLSPSIFSFAKTAQTALADALPKIILNGETGVKMNADKVADDIAYYTALGFLGYSSEDCKDGSIKGLGEPSDPNKKGEVIFSSIETIMENSAQVVDNQNCGGELFSGKPKTNRYSFNYLCIFAGGFLVFVLLSMVVDISIRTIKFGFLELIAPIPIASYIDPKTSKKSFDSWVHNTISVYIDLFIRLGVIYFSLYLFQMIAEGFTTVHEVDNVPLDAGRNALVNVAIIIGIFMFAKSAPKFICDILGIKSDGNIGDMFKRATGFAGAGLAGLKTAGSNAVSQYRRLKSKTGSSGSAVAGALRSAAAGFTSATARGLKAATFDKKGFSDVRKSSAKAAISARDARNDRVDNLYTNGSAFHSAEDRKNGAYGWFEYQKDKFESSMGIPSTPGYNKAVYDVMDKIAQSTASEKSFGATKMNERPNTFTVKVQTKYMDAGVEKTKFVDYTIASARSYASIQVGTENVHKPDGTIGTWTVEDQAKALEVQQTVEKRTSYLTTANLIKSGDPTAIMNHQKTMLTIKNNETMFNDKAIMSEITDVFRKKGLVGPTDDMNYEKLISLTDEEYLRSAGVSEEKVADTIDALKTSFEKIRTKQYAQAQADAARAEKTKQAINNDKK